MKQIQIPSGMRDIFPQECTVKNGIREKMMAVFKSYGYREIETPLLEFYSTYRESFTSLADETLYKFVDENGRILVLRTDMTLPIARMCAAKYANRRPPFRFSYCANVYKVRQSFAGKRNEITDCGIELIGLDERSDLEVLSCAAKVLQELFTDHYMLEIGNGRFFWKACEAAGIQEEQGAILSDLIDRKSMIDTEQFLDTLELDSSVHRFFARLPLLNGPDALVEAEEILFSDTLLEIVKHLRSLREGLQELGYGNHVMFDLGKVPHLNYYTGIIFEGYTDGIGSAILSGGRYDTLLSKLGRDLPAIGFGVKTDAIVPVIDMQEDPVQTLYYEPGNELEALRKAEEMRKNGAVELIPLTGEKGI